MTSTTKADSTEQENAQIDKKWNERLEIMRMELGADSVDKDGEVYVFRRTAGIPTRASAADVDCFVDALNAPDVKTKPLKPDKAEKEKINKDV